MTTLWRYRKNWVCIGALLYNWRDRLDPAEMPGESPPQSSRESTLRGGSRFCPFAFADLLRRELASANAAAPTGRRKCCGPWHMLGSGTSGPQQLATTLRTLSLNHSHTPRTFLVTSKYQWPFCWME